jgi:hypothetical protein
MRPAPGRAPEIDIEVPELHLVDALSTPRDSQAVLRGAQGAASREPTLKFRSPRPERKNRTGAADRKRPRPVT